MVIDVETGVADKTADTRNSEQPPNKRKCIFMPVLLLVALVVIGSFCLSGEALRAPLNRRRKLLADARPGDLVTCGDNGKECELVKKLGEGAFGVVYKAARVDGSGNVAIKMPLEVSYKDFSAEVNGFAAVEGSQHAVQLIWSSQYSSKRDFDLRSVSEQPIIVMSFVDGSELKKWPALAEEQTDPAFAAETMLNIITQIGKVYKNVNGKGKRYNDCKLENIMINARGDFLYAVDFGLIRDGDNVLRGTPLWMPPEAWSHPHDKPAFRTYEASANVALWDIRSLLNVVWYVYGELCSKEVVLTAQDIKIVGGNRFCIQAKKINKQVDKCALTNRFSDVIRISEYRQQLVQMKPITSTSKKRKPVLVLENVMFKAMAEYYTEFKLTSDGRATQILGNALDQKSPSDTWDALLTDANSLLADSLLAGCVHKIRRSVQKGTHVIQCDENNFERPAPAKSKLDRLRFKPTKCTLKATGSKMHTVGKCDQWKCKCYEYAERASLNKNIPFEKWTLALETTKSKVVHLIVKTEDTVLVKHPFPGIHTIVAS